MPNNLNDQRWELIQKVLGWILTASFTVVGIFFFQGDWLSSLGYFALAFVVCPLSEAPVWVKLLIGFLALFAL